MSKPRVTTDAQIGPFDRAKFPDNTPKYKFWLARLFGKQVKARDGICTLYAYRWFGHVYVVGMEIHAGTPE
jgi:hypothetical protein